LKAFLVVIIGGLGLFGAFSAQAATYTAASSAESDVAAAVARATNGDTVQIPCSPASSVWTTQLLVTKSITITGMGATPNSGPGTFGAGTNCLTLRDNNPTSSIIALTPTYASSNNLTVLQNINIDPYTATTALATPVTAVGTATPSGFPQVRIDNVIFGHGVQWTEAGNGAPASWMIIQDDVVGVFDHNTVPTGSNVALYSANMSAYLGVGDFGDNSWAQPDTLGQATAIYAENNSMYMGYGIEMSESEASDSYPDIGGARVVNRFNQVVSNGAFFLTGGHGLDTGGRTRSIRHSETYKNTLVCISGSGCPTAFTSYRGGTGLTWGNTATTTGSGFYNYIFDFSVYRTVYANSGGGVGGCGNASSGSSAGPFDKNDGVTYYSGTMTSGSSGQTMNDSSKSWNTNQLAPAGAPYSVFDVTQGFVAQIVSNTATSITMNQPTPEQSNSFNTGDSYQIRRATVCMDQGGRGQGLLLQGAPPSPVLASTGAVGPVNQALDPIYEWDNSVTHLNNGNVGFEDAGQMLKNRDYYTDNSNGTPVAQTSPTSPFNGSGGVGFGTLTNRPSSCTTGVAYWATDQGNWNQSGSGGQGELFKCTANTWTLGYTPYAYPHPLTAGGTAGSGPTGPSSPMNLVGTVH
jgi:hypothetical protein